MKEQLRINKVQIIFKYVTIMALLRHMGYVPYVARKTGATNRNEKEQKFEGTKFQQDI
jgi:hypothetical protein